MGRANHLVEGLSGTGKSSVCRELTRRGFQAVDGDRELAYPGDPETGAPLAVSGRDDHVWDVAKVRALVADQREEVTFFCGGSRNFPAFVDAFDTVLVLEVDLATLHRRLDARPDEHWRDGRPTDRALVTRWHRTKETVPAGVAIDATAPLDQVVDEVLRRCGVVPRSDAS
ncbi:AAA family ATPase [Cellulomonas xiejunii]|uniref:Nucleoside kinase n=1 Tax=Cellulomonas xiejunii TaxID=2968083 RepID=A0ABY5KRA8_9CELL|nr:nucleoside kinase [Cellulomonas xiejunii]MCC2322205.1 nucleoside kinase [Cellulomonas xiejunii]UUI72258.1 nucleoside kinase [Cellulomonas xiejunii]